LWLVIVNWLSPEQPLNFDLKRDAATTAIKVTIATNSDNSDKSFSAQKIYDTRSHISWLTILKGHNGGNSYYNAKVN
jgi:hypothetical protein